MGFHDGYVGALKNASTLDADGVKAALEQLTDFDTKGLTAAPITFTPTDHRPNTSLFVYKVDIAGDLVPVTRLNLERKPEWLGQ